MRLTPRGYVVACLLLVALTPLLLTASAHLGQWLGRATLP